MQPGEREVGLVERIRRLTEDAVIEIGVAPAGVLIHWSPVSTTRVVLTGERYAHILLRHPELGGREAELLRTIADPIEIHRNTRDAQIAILYRRLADESWIRVALLVSNRTDFQHSVHSARMAPERERRKGREAHRLVWER